MLGSVAVPLRERQAMVSYLDKAGLQHVIKKFRDTFYPVGSIFISTNSTSPAKLIGGTWTKFSQGRTLVGASDTDSDFAIGKTGGEKTHKLSIDEMPAHRHGLHVGYKSSGDGDLNYDILWFTHPDPGKAWWNDFRHINEVGGSKPHNNLPPYITVYFWQRIS